MKSLKLLIGDPGKTNDPFGVIALEGMWPEKKIRPRRARQFKRKSYVTVASYFQRMNKQIHFDMMLIEKNFDYENVSKAFAHLPIKYVTTSSDLTEQTRAKGWSIDKPYMIGWLQQQYRKHNVLYPSKQSPDMQELIKQRNEMVGITGPSNHTSYKRTRNRHDDLFLALLIGCNAIRIWWDIQ